jgi:hypothetical protein
MYQQRWASVTLLWPSFSMSKLPTLRSLATEGDCRPQASSGSLPELN